MQTTQRHRPAFSTHQQPQDSRPSAQPATAPSAHVPATAAMLNPGLQPIRHGERYYGNQQKRFYASMAKLCKYYGLKAPSRSKKQYPINMLEDFQALKAAYNKAGGEHDLFVTDEAGKSGTLVSSQMMQGHAYHIPINLPLRLLRRNKYQRLSHLMQVTMTYIYRIAGISLFSDEGNDIYRSFDYLYQMVMEVDTDEDDASSLIRELENASSDGYEFSRAIGQEQCLDHWESLLAAYRPRTPWQKRFKACSSAFLALYRQFPDANMYQNIQDELYSDEDNGVVSLDFMLALSYNGSAQLQYHVDHMLDNDIGERQVEQFPCHIRYFGAMPEADSSEALAYEHRFQKLFAELTDLIRNYSTAKS